MDEEFDLAGAYVAGVIDGGSSLTVEVGKSQQARFGYRISPSISLRRSNSEIIQVVDEWAVEHGVHGRIQEKGNSVEWKLEARDDVRAFLEAIDPYLIVHDNQAKIILNEILPRLEDGKHTTREGFLETVEYADMVRSDTSSGSNKYDAAYFEDLWENEIDR